MNPVVIYTSAWCPFCIRALHLLDKKGIGYKNINVDGRPAVRQAMAEKAGSTSVPQIWVGDTHVGGCDDLHALEGQGQLDTLLKS
ncbi:glutaredoxin 3 [Candidatus Sororendozoicomonas aggregata]|uniref:glutaredoxin 3 n=1 Tax=Candidatus Sororendozoicomonas aggregata TaxID=3073239 RepID=UPI002ED69BB9